ncbi:MAG: hypothetical protein ABEJ76_05830 [Halanaeroarchaeum sp.]
MTMARGDSVALEEAGAPTPGAAEPSREEVFEILSNQRRRHAVHYLRQHEDETVRLRELSRQLSAWETGTALEDVTHKQRKRVYTALRQTHLPKMDDAGVVDYDDNRGVVQPTDYLEDVEIYLDVVPDHEIPRSEYYLGLSAVAGALLAAVQVGAYPFDQVPAFGWAVVIVAAFGLSAAVDVYYDARRRLGSDGPPPEVDASD